MSAGEDLHCTGGDADPNDKKGFSEVAVRAEEVGGREVQEQAVIVREEATTPLPQDGEFVIVAN